MITFHLTFNYVYKEIKTEINNTFSKDNIENIKNKIRSEFEIAINKDIYINPEDAKIINKFLEKIKSDLNRNK